MFGRRNASKDIWRAVVMAGAMLGAGAGCGGSSAGNGADTTPVTNTAGTETTGGDDLTGNPCAGMVEGDNPCEAVTTDNPCGDVATDNPCGDGWEEGVEDERVRGSGEGGGVGRGFILA
jgi:hypothetical protein